MPSDVGAGYQAPPESPDIDPATAQRIRELEDYISRRIKAQVELSSQAMPGLAITQIEYDSTIYDTSGLWVPSSHSFVIPQGAEGDYLVQGQYHWLTGPPDLMGFYEIVLNGDVILSIQSPSDSSFATMTNDFALITDVSMRPGDELFAQFIKDDTGSDDLGTVGNGLQTRLSIRRLL